MSYKIRGFCVSVVNTEFCQIVSSVPMARRVSITDLPFCLMLHQMALLVAQHFHRDLPDEKIEFVIDQQTNGVDETKKMWPLVQSATIDHGCNNVYDTLSPTFRNDKEVIPIQAADMFAWYHRRNLEHGLGDDPIFQAIRAITVSDTPISQDALSYIRCKLLQATPTDPNASLTGPGKLARQDGRSSLAPYSWPSHTSRSLL